jgi:hypothetical protein
LQRTATLVLQHCWCYGTVGVATLLLLHVAVLRLDFYLFFYLTASGEKKEQDSKHVSWLYWLA